MRKKRKRQKNKITKEDPVHYAVETAAATLYLPQICLTSRWKGCKLKLHLIIHFDSSICKDEWILVCTEHNGQREAELLDNQD